MWRRCYHSQPSLCTSPPRCNYTNLQYKSIVNFSDCYRKAPLLLSLKGSVCILKRQATTSRWEDIFEEQNVQMRGNNPKYINQYLSQLLLSYIIIATINLFITIKYNYALTNFSSFQYNQHSYMCLVILYFNIKRKNTALHHYSAQYHRKRRAMRRFLNWHTDYQKWIRGYMDVNLDKIMKWNQLAL